MDVLLKGPKLRALLWDHLPEVLAERSLLPGTWLTFHHGKTETTRTAAQVLDEALGWAHALREAGVQPGDRVAVFEPNSPEFVAAFFGVQLAGATPVPVPWPVVESATPALPTGAEAMLATAGARVLVAPAGVTGVPAGVTRVSAPSTQRWAGKPSAQTPAFIQFTSGSTGAPRGAVISQRAAIASATAMAQGLALNSSDVGVSWLPLFHDMGLVGVLLTSLVAGFPVHLLRPGEVLLHPRRWLELLSLHRATLTVAPNFGYELVLRRGKPDASLDLSALRAALNGSEPVLASTMENFEARFAACGLQRGAVLPVYGLAENTLGVTFPPPCTREPLLTWHGRAVPSVGAALPGQEIALLAGADGEGEICVRGPSVMDGYWGDEAATARALQDGWLRTGDRGVVRDGRLYITGREKDLIIKGGRKLHPVDIERVVAEVVDTPPNGVAAFSVLRDAGEQLVVVVEQRRRGEGDVTQKVRAHIAAQLGVTADHIELVGAGTLPRTTSGKLQRHACVTRFAAALDAARAEPSRSPAGAQPGGAA